MEPQEVTRKLYETFSTPELEDLYKAFGLDLERARTKLSKDFDKSRRALIREILKKRGK